MLEKEPDGRPASVTEVRERLIKMRDLAMKSGQSLFERSTGLERSFSNPSGLRPARPTTADEPSDKSKRPAPRPNVGADTVPEPRESQMMPVADRLGTTPELRAATAQVAPLGAPPTAPSPSRTPLIVGAVCGVLALGVGGWFFLGQKPVPAPPPVV